MAKPNLISLLTLLFSSLCISICEGAINSAGSSNRKLLNTVRKQITNPANFPPYTPTTVTIPSSNPTPVTPVTSSPSSNVPLYTYPPAQPISTGVEVGGGVGGGSWCVAQPSAPQTELQSALDYACGIGGVDCSAIQSGAPCFNPNSLQSHASFAFNTYFQKNPVATSCDFGGVAVIVNANPSSGSCIYPSSGAGTATPASNNPPATTSSTNGASGLPYGGGVGSPYVVPASGNYGSPPGLGYPTSYGPDTPPTAIVFPAGAVTASDSTQLCTSFAILLASVCITKLILRT